MASWALDYQFFSWWDIKYTSGFDVYLWAQDNAAVQEFISFFHVEEMPDQVYVVG